MFPSSFLVQASADVPTSADAIRTCATAADIFVDHLQAKVFTVVSSSTVWDPGGFSRAAAVQRSTWRRQRAKEVGERHQHCLAFTSLITSATGWIGEEEEIEVRHIVSCVGYFVFFCFE